MQKQQQKWLKPCYMVHIWEYSAQSIQWTPTWHGLDGFQLLLRPCALDESSLSIGRVENNLGIKDEFVKFFFY